MILTFRWSLSEVVCTFIYHNEIQLPNLYHVHYVQCHTYTSTILYLQAGRCPEQYHIESCGKDEYVRLQRGLRGFTMDVYLAETNFQQSLSKAVKVNTCDNYKVCIRVLSVHKAGDCLCKN